MILRFDSLGKSIFFDQRKIDLYRLINLLQKRILTVTNYLFSEAAVITVLIYGRCNRIISKTCEFVGLFR